MSIDCRLSCSPPRLLLLALLAPWLFTLSAVVADDGRGLRTWTSNEGKVLEAALVLADDRTVTLDRKDGSNLVTLPLGRLSFEDQAYLAGVKALRETTVAAGEWPVQTAPQGVQVTEVEPGRFQTQNFEFGADLVVSAEFIEEAAKIFEGTVVAISALPFDIRAKFPPQMDRFMTIFNKPENFNVRAAERYRVHPFEPNLGAYIGLHSAMLVPYHAIGGRVQDGVVVLGENRNVDTGHLIHELAHQVMDSMLRVFPHWFNEGLAEYLALIPQASGQFRFDEAEAGLKETLKLRYQSVVPEIVHPRDLLSGKNFPAWDTSLDGYRSSMLLFYFLIHLDQGPKGEPVAKMIRTLQAIDERAWALVAEYNQAVKDFVPVREAYNRALDRYKEEIASYRKQIAGSGVDSPVRVGGGGAEGDRVVVGSLSAIKMPVAPKQPAIPDILRHRREGKSIEVADLASTLALEAILRGRSFDELADAMKRAYEGIGISITVRPARRAE